MVKQIFKNFGMAIAPRLTMELLSARSQKLIMRIERKTGCLEASQNFISAHGRTVLRGPFNGLRYPAEIAKDRNLVHRLVGSYERELHPWIEEIFKNSYSMIVNIGMADGFYTVGFAMRMPKIPVVGFDTDPWARRATQTLAKENSVNNVEVLSFCTANWLRENLLCNSFVFSDCEGFEAVLFDPGAVPNLTNCDMVIELHERVSPGIEEKIRTRFIGTHEIRMATYVDRDPAEFPELQVIDARLRAKVIGEGRGGPQNVLFLTKRNSKIKASHSNRTSHSFSHLKLNV